MKNKRTLSVGFAGMGMMALILDASSALCGASEGIDLCIRTVIPSMFPFLVLSIFLTGQMFSLRLRWLRPLGRLLHLPENAEVIFLVGLLGGYPMGAQCIRQAYDTGGLSRPDAQRMLCFCSNAGPAFLFGIGARLLGNVRLCWMVWAVHILSAILIGMFVPAGKSRPVTTQEGPNLSLTDAVRRAAGVMAVICSWIVLFRILLSFLEKWIYPLIPGPASIALSGLLELTNGCAALMQLQSPEYRIVLFSAILGFGGLCVGLQTGAVLAGSGLQMGPYFLGKAAQGVLSGLLCMLILQWLPCGKISIAVLWMSVIITIVCCLSIFYRNKKWDSIPQENDVY